MDPYEPDSEGSSPSAELKESIRARLPRAVPPPPIREPDPPLEDTSPIQASRRAAPRSKTNDQVVAALYVLTILVLFFVVVRYIISVELDDNTLIYFGLPLLAIGYLAREILARLSGDGHGDEPPPKRGR